MAKTDYTNGSYVTPAALDFQWGIDATTGHIHDGLDSDGHIPKILLTDASHVTGELPVANISFGANLAIDVKITDSYVTVEQTGVFKYTKIGNIVNMKFQEMIGASNSTDLSVLPDSTWPASILAEASEGGDRTTRVCGYAIDYDAEHTCLIEIPRTDTGPFSFLIMRDGTTFAADNFTDSGLKGVRPLEICWMAGE